MNSPYRDEKHTKIKPKKSRSAWWRLVRKIQIKSALSTAWVISGEAIGLAICLASAGCLIFGIGYCDGGYHIRNEERAEDRLRYDKSIAEMRSELFAEINKAENCQDVVLKNSEINHGHRCPHVQHSLKQGNGEYIICSCGRKPSNE